MKKSKSTAIAMLLCLFVALGTSPAFGFFWNSKAVPPDQLIIKANNRQELQESVGKVLKALDKEKAEIFKTSAFIAYKSSVLGAKRDIRRTKRDNSIDKTMLGYFGIEAGNGRLSDDQIKGNAEEMLLTTLNEQNAYDVVWYAYGHFKMAFEKFKHNTQDTSTLSGRRLQSFVDSLDAPLASDLPSKKEVKRLKRVKSLPVKEALAILQKNEDYFLKFFEDVPEDYMLKEVAIIKTQGYSSRSAQSSVAAKSLLPPKHQGYYDAGLFIYNKQPQAKTTENTPHNKSLYDIIYCAVTWLPDFDESKITDPVAVFDYLLTNSFKKNQPHFSREKKKGFETYSKSLHRTYIAEKYNKIKNNRNDFERDLITYYQYTHRTPKQFELVYINKGKKEWHIKNTTQSIHKKYPNMKRTEADRIFLEDLMQLQSELLETLKSVNHDASAMKTPC